MLYNYTEMIQVCFIIKGANMAVIDGCYYGSHRGSNHCQLNVVYVSVHS